MIEITKEHIKEIEEHAAALSVDQMADLLGFERSKFKEALRKRPDVLKIYKRARAMEIAGIARALINGARNGCRHRQQIFLERIGGWSSLADDGLTEESKRRAIDEWYDNLRRDIDSRNEENNG